MQKRRVKRAGSMTEEQFWCCASKKTTSHGRGIDGAFRVLVHGEHAKKVAHDLGITLSSVNHCITRITKHHDRNLDAYRSEKQIQPVFLSGNSDDLAKAKRKKMDRPLLPTPSTSLSLSALLGCE